MTWLFGDNPPSEVEVRLSPGPDGDTVFELEHSGIENPEQWEKFGPGAVGVGWDLAIAALGLHLCGDDVDPAAWEQSPEAKECKIASSTAWGIAFETFGAAPDVVASVVANTTAFYTGEPSPTPSHEPGD